MTRTLEQQLEISTDILEANLKKLQTSLNNFRAERGNSAYLRLIHLQSDALSVAFAVEKTLLLQLMRDTTDE